MAARLEPAFGFFDATRSARHPWLFTPAPAAEAPVLSISSMALGAFGELRAMGFTPPPHRALGLGPGSAGRVDRRHPGAPRPGHLPAACPGRGRHHRRCGRLTGALRLFRLRMAAPQPGVHGRPLPSAGRRPIQPRLSRHRRRGARLAGRDLGRTPAVDRRKLDLARGGDPPGPAWSVLNRPTTAGRGHRLRPAVAGCTPGSRYRRVVRRRRGRAPQRGQRHLQAVRDLRAARLGDPAPARDRRLRARRRRPRARLRRPGVQRVRPDAGAVRAALPRQRDTVPRTWTPLPLPRS